MKFVKMPLRVKFLFFMILLFAMAFFVNRDYAIVAMDGFLSLLARVLPIMLVVFFIMFLSNLFLNDKIIRKHLGSESGFMGWVWCLFTGVLVPSPPYIVFPLLGDLRKKGMRDALIVCFLYARNLQIAFLPVMAFYFGIEFTIIVSVFVFIFAILSGIVIEKFVNV